MPKANAGTSTNFEATLWAAADKLRGTLDAAEYKHVVLGLIFLKYISDSFEQRRAELQELSRDKDSDLYVKDEAQREHLLEDKDEYSAVNVFWVPPKARWSELQKNAKRSEIAQVIDGAMDAIERANPRLRGVLPADYARRNVAAEKLGELIDLVGSIPLGDKKSKAIYGQESNPTTWKLVAALASGWFSYDQTSQSAVAATCSMHCNRKQCDMRSWSTRVRDPQSAIFEFPSSNDFQFQYSPSPNSKPSRAFSARWTTRSS